MKHYIIDGYNLLFTLSESGLEIEEARNEMIHFLHQHLIDRKALFTFVFDSSPNNAWEFEYLTPFTIIFSPPRLSADQYILEMVQGKKSPGNLTVVTSDKLLATEVRALSAQVQTTKSFLRFCRKRKKISEKEFFSTEKENQRWKEIFEKKLQDD